MVGGTTPSAGLMSAVKERVRIPVFVMIRPRDGRFVHSASELDVMARDIKFAKQLGADGFAVGVLDEAGRVDIPGMQRLLDVAGESPVTFHMAIDVTADPDVALDTLLELGISRVLTRGAAPTAREGAARIASWVSRAGPAMTIMAGGGVRETNVAEIIRKTGVQEVHARLVGLTPGLFREIRGEGSGAFEPFRRA
jgi:copper homeostasis protein